MGKSLNYYFIKKREKQWRRSRNRIKVSFKKKDKDGKIREYYYWKYKKYKPDA